MEIKFQEWNQNNICLIINNKNKGKGKKLIFFTLHFTSIFIGTRKKKKKERRNGQSKPSMSNCKYFHPNDRMIFINEAGQGPFVPPPLPPLLSQILCRLKGYIHRSCSFCCRGSRDGPRNPSGLSDHRSIIVSTADIDIILSSLRKNTKSREPSHSTRGSLSGLGRGARIFERNRKRILLDKIKFTTAVHVIYRSLLERSARRKEGR